MWFTYQVCLQPTKSKRLQDFHYFRYADTWSPKNDFLTLSRQWTCCRNHLLHGVKQSFMLWFLARHSPWYLMVWWWRQLSRERWQKRRKHVFWHNLQRCPPSWGHRPALQITWASTRPWSRLFTRSASESLRLVRLIDRSLMQLLADTCSRCESGTFRKLFHNISRFVRFSPVKTRASQTSQHGNLWNPGDVLDVNVLILYCPLEILYWCWIYAFKISFRKVDLALEAKSVSWEQVLSHVLRGIHPYISVQWIMPLHRCTCFPAPEEKTSAPRNPMSSFLAPTSVLKNLNHIACLNCRCVSGSSWHRQRWGIFWWIFFWGHESWLHFLGYLMCSLVHINQWYDFQGSCVEEGTGPWEGATNPGGWIKSQGWNGVFDVQILGKQLVKLNTLKIRAHSLKKHTEKTKSYKLSGWSNYGAGSLGMAQTSVHVVSYSSDLDKSASTTNSSTVRISSVIITNVHVDLSLGCTDGCFVHHRPGLPTVANRVIARNRWNRCGFVCLLDSDCFSKQGLF